MTESVWIHYARPRPHWYALAADKRAERRAVWAGVAQESEARGGRRIGTYHVRGQHDFETVEIWGFPSVEAAFDHWVRLTGHAYNEWFAFANNIGIDKSRGAAEPRPGSKVSGEPMP
jgi:hypothetical protein